MSFFAWRTWQHLYLNIELLMYFLLEGEFVLENNHIYKKSQRKIEGSNVFSVTKIFKYLTLSYLIQSINYFFGYVCNDVHFKIRISSGKKIRERGGWGKKCVGYSENILVTNVETDNAQIFTKSQQKKRTNYQLLASIQTFKVITKTFYC